MSADNIPPLPGQRIDDSAVLSSAELPTDARVAESLLARRSLLQRDSPRLTFSLPGNPFSPPASIRSFNAAALADNSPLSTPGLALPGLSGHFPFPDGPVRNEIMPNASGIDIVHSSPSYASRRDLSGTHTRHSSSARLRDTFSAPPLHRSRANSILSAAGLAPVKATQRARSTMLSESAPPLKPWLEKGAQDPYSRVAYFLTYGVVFLGVAASAIQIYLGFTRVPMIKQNLCMVLDDEFDSADAFGPTATWFREVEIGGFGNGEFELTTSSDNNSFVKDGQLFIVPTLTSDVIGSSAVLNGYTYNLTDCTYNLTQNVYATQTLLANSSTNSTSNSSDPDFDADAYYQACGAVSNVTAGTVINPAQSARLSTRYSANIRYGKVEVKAKLPTGDWLWPAIWMLPVNNTYGGWPLSGEIDIMEARGNGINYPDQGSNVVRGSLNWGPTTFINAVAKTFGWWSERRSSYASDFHVYTLEWTPEFMRISVDSRLHHLLNLKFDESFFDRGDFPPVVQNGSDSIVLENPWVNGSNAAPFDQPFYLILDVAVGGTSGWFPDNSGSKPWIDKSQTAMRDFALSQDQWYPTWPQSVEDRAMIIDYVKMWQLC